MGSCNFDVDLREGQIAEGRVRDLLRGRAGPIEVKRDTIVSKTGNIAVEFECRGYPSGIRTTAARWWVFELAGPKYDDEILIWIEATRLRALCEYHIAKGDYEDGGDDDQSKMVLLHLGRLLLWDPALFGVKQEAIT